MKSILVILSQGPLGGQRILESLSATLVLATFGHQVKVCLLGDAIHLLNRPLALNPPLADQDKALQPSNFNTSNVFKSAHAMLESFEFYDLLPILVAGNSSHADIINPAIEIENIHLSPDLLNQFDQVLYW